MVDYEKAVFISYAWGGESQKIVNQIERALQRRGIKIIRDIRNLEYKGSISQFMERIGQGSCVIVVISDKYLRSKNCMFELVEIAENKQFSDRIFPIILPDAKIYDAVERLEYVDHWDKEKAKLNERLKGLSDLSNLQGIPEELNNYDRFRDKISGLTSILKDMNTLTPEIHRNSDFSELYKALENRIHPDGLPTRSRPRSNKTSDSKKLPADSQKMEEDGAKTADTTKTQEASSLQATLAANLLINNRSQAVSNDKPQPGFQLSIREEVEALAETLLLREVEPPVTVGIIGGSGSAKSFAMHLIHQSVQSIRTQPVKKGWTDEYEKDAEIPFFVGHIYQIQFNAWTNARSNLWAGLMNAIFSGINRQMQLERLLAHRMFSPGNQPSMEQIKESMMVGGNEFKKIYWENVQLDQDRDLRPWQQNLEYWSQYLLRDTLLWNILRGQQMEKLKKLKDAEEQFNQLKASREQFEKVRPFDDVTVNSLELTTRQAYFQSIKSFMLAFLSDHLSTTAKDVLKKQDVREDEVQKYLDGALGLSGIFMALLATFRRSKFRLIWTVNFLVITLAAPYIWGESTFLFIHPGILKIISLVLAFIPMLAGLLPAVRKSNKAGVEVKKILERAYGAQQSKHAEEITNSINIPLPQKIINLQTEISKGSLAAYDLLMNLLKAQAEEQRREIGPAAKYSNLTEFIQSRIDDSKHEDQSDLIQQVRQDIDELTFGLMENSGPDIFPRGKPRVILYIDDLDRCPPPRVAEVFEAVQLLLNTKLFIIILGIDAQNVSRALEKESMQNQGNQTGLEYLEKAIQIPYCVRPIESNNLKNYLEQQMDVAKTALDSMPPIQIQQPLEQFIPTENEAGIEPSLPGAFQEPEATVFIGPQVKDLPYITIQFKQEDLDDLATCCQKVTITPRSVKRLINVFKLIKIFWFRGGADAGIDDRDPPRIVKQAALCLLALSYAHPEIMREVFTHLGVLYRQGQVKMELFNTLHSIKLPPGTAQELSLKLERYKADISALYTITGNGQDYFGQITLQDLQLSTFNIVRSFSFVGDSF